MLVDIEVKKLGGAGDPVTNVVKIKLSKEQLRDELRLPPAAEIMAATVMDTELIVWVKHPQAPGHNPDGTTPEFTLSDLRVLAPEVI